MAYQLKTQKLFIKDRIVPFRIPTLEVEEDEEVGLIQGQVPRSVEEWRVAQALWALKREFTFQLSLFGGTSRRGGYVVDFYVEAVPAWVPLEVQSERWHTGKFARDEKLRQIIIERELGAEMKFVWEDELTSKGDAIIAVRNALDKPQARRL